MGGILIAVVGFFDGLDGAVARSSNDQTILGAFLDASLDRLGEGVIYLGMIFYFLRNPAPSGVILVFIVAMNSQIISYLRASARIFNLESSYSIFVRGARLIILSVGLFTSQIYLVLWILAIGTGFTLLHRFISAIRSVDQQKTQ